ncbi:MAG: phosphatidylserine decarboxylase family protein [Paludibacteraceae bacterium]|nr:phosphatidylserine decarboxylase family protein [Paludibacteraceae bacterium]MEE3484135.1 phosphatidylserine decarboxylase family protein [Bacteroidales bacterium]
MRIHKEGKKFLLKVLVGAILINMLLWIVCGANHPTWLWIFSLVSIVLFLFLTNFFRNPERIFENFEDGMIVAPADGTIVVIEPTVEDEYLKEKRIQVSIFMSVLNVHANWYPTHGKIVYYTHNDGNFMRANLPKSSTENERSTVVIETPNKVKILVRQVAGAMARRIVTYAREGDECNVNTQLGFIKFGSRVDVYLPLDAEIMVNMKQSVVGNQTIIARLKK